MIELIKHTVVITEAEHPEVDSDDIDVIMEHADFQTRYEQLYLPEEFTHDKITTYLQERDLSFTKYYYNVQFLASKPVKAYIADELVDELTEAIKDSLNGYHVGHGNFYDSQSDWTYEPPTEEEKTETVTEILKEVGLYEY